MSEEILYSDYDVMTQKDHWDDNTRQIVEQRFGPFKEPQFLTKKECEYIAIIAGYIAWEDSEDILNWIVYYFDDKFTNHLGEGQRKKGVPPERKLFRDGIKLIDRISYLEYKQIFSELDDEKRLDLLGKLSVGKAPVIGKWTGDLQKLVFKKLGTLTLQAYYSHPTIWSEIGYGGPAYPRGYIRISLGKGDPWEADFIE